MADHRNDYVRPDPPEHAPGLPVGSRLGRSIGGRRQRQVIWVGLWLWTLLWALVHTPGGGYSWHYFSLAARLLIGRGPSTGLHIYAAHPELQMGPLAMLAAIPLRAINPALGYAIAPALLTLTGPLLLALLVRGREASSGQVSPAMLAVTGLFALPVWTEVTTHYAHLDDILAMAFAVGALLAARRNRAVLTGLLLAGGVDAKPWALGFCILLFVLTPSARIIGAFTAAAGIALIWLPFVLADPGTLSLTHFTIDNVDDSALRALGVHTSGTPSWDRPAQLLLGLAAGAAAIWRGRWPTVLLAVLAVRLLLDPQTYPYYSSSLVLAAAAADLLTTHRRLPLWTAACSLWYVLNEILIPVAPPGAVGALRALFCLALIGATLAPSRRDTPMAGVTGSDLHVPYPTVRSLSASRPGPARPLNLNRPSTNRASSTSVRAPAKPPVMPLVASAAVTDGRESCR